MNQTAVPRQKSVTFGPVLTGAVLSSSSGLGIFSPKVALVHYYPLLLDGFQVAKWNLPGGNWKPLLCALSAINPFLFALCTFKHCHPIPPSVSSSFNLLHLFSQARFGVSPGSCSPLDSPLVPISLQISAAGIVVSSQYLTRGGEKLPVYSLYSHLCNPEWHLLLMKQHAIYCLIHHQTQTTSAELLLASVLPSCICRAGH